MPVNDLVRVLEQVGIVGDIDAGDIQGLQGGHDFRLGLGVNMRGTFVEKQDSGLAIQGPGEK